MFAPMKMGFPTGMAGGGIAQFLQPLQEYLTQTVNSEKIQPFIDEISQLAQDRFDVDFGGGITNPGTGGGLFGGGMPLPDKGFDFSNPFPNLPPVQQPVMNTEPSGPVAGISNFGPDVGNGIPTAKPYDHVNDSITGYPSPNEPMQPAVPDIDQGFFDSQEYLDFMSKPQMGTSDVYMSRYFGQMGSGSLGGMQEKAYEDYLNRTGQADLIRANNPNSSPGGLADGFGNLFQLPSVGPMYGPEGTYSLTGRPQPVPTVNQ